MEDEDLLGSNMKNDVLRYVGGKNKTSGLTSPQGPSPVKKDKSLFEKTAVPFASLSDKYIAKDPVGRESSEQLKNWYENPETMRRLSEQTGLSKEDVQNRLMSAYSAETKITSKLPRGAQGEYLSADWGRDKKTVLVAPDAEKGTGFHEKVHATEMDDMLGEKLLKITGKPKGLKDTKEYLSKPGEAYAKFSELRINLGLKPGQKIKDAKQLKEMAKKKGLEYDMFLQSFDADKIKDAINTIASSEGKKANKNYA